MTKIVFYVVVSDQIGIYINWAHKNDCQNLRFLRDINEVAKKMVRNGFKTAKSLGCAFHFKSEFTSSICNKLLTILKNIILFTKTIFR